MDGAEIFMHEGDPVTTPAEQRFWSKPLVLVLVSIILSSGITTIGMSVGWKASIDTTTAVYAVKMQDQGDRLTRLEENDKDRIKASDLAMRDQLLDAKLSLLQSEIASLKDQVSTIQVVRR